MSLTVISQQITIYLGLFIFLIGIIGNSINIRIFSIVRTYRRTPSAFYFLISSISNLIYLLTCLSTRILSNGFNYDLTRTSLIFCKLRYFCISTFPLISTTCSCLVIVDQYFVTSQSANIRRLSNMKWTYRIVVLMIILSMIDGIPVFIFCHIQSTTSTCVNTNANYAVYNLIYLFVLLLIIPILVMFIFGYLTFRNIKLTRVLREEQADRQLTQMIFIQTILLAVSVFPYGTSSAYSLITTNVEKNQNRLEIESFIVAIISLWFYIYHAGSCYMFLISSSRFRQETKDRLFSCLRPNQINPIPTLSTTHRQ